MKKILSISMMMVAMMVATFSLVSCSSDDDDNKNNQYRLDISLNISEPGNLTEAECEEMIMQAAQRSTVATHNSDAEAKTATGMAAQAMAHGLDEAKAGFGDAVFSYTFKCTKVSNGAQVITYYVDFSKGDINCYNNEN